MSYLRRIAWLLIVLITGVSYLPGVREISRWPSEVTLPRGDCLLLPAHLPFLHLRGERAGCQRGHAIIRAQNLGATSLVLALGPVPLERITVDTVLPERVFLGGQAIGVVAYGAGTEVVGNDPFASTGTRFSPGWQAGLRPGDRILKVDGAPILQDESLAGRINAGGQAGQVVSLLVRRDGREFTQRIRPAKDLKSGRYRLGLWVRDEVAGVGTLSFWEADGRFAALGHGLTDYTAGRLLPLRKGQVTAAIIGGVAPSKAGQPGRKLGLLDPDGSFAGRLEGNSLVGIYGHWLRPPVVGPSYPVATPAEVHPGPAKLFTVLRGRRVVAYNVEIIRVFPSSQTREKSLFLRATDRRLLKTAGGIVQGMSGSPILQDGRLVGALTHVLVRDPRFGYGVLAEWMLRR